MMVPEVDMSEKIDTAMDVSPVSTKDNSNSTMKLPDENFVVCASNCEDHDFVDTVAKNPEENLVMACASNCEDTNIQMEGDCDQDMMSKGRNVVAEIDIVENVNPDEETMVERESLDATENSSSFGCTDSGTGTTGGTSDVEVESQVRDDNGPLIEFDGFDGLFGTRKKKLTPHWRNFIRPLMWRCKWVELHIRELRSQAAKYDRELAECSRRKQCELEKCADGNLAVKETPVYQNRSGKIMKRMKRKRVEETVDLAAYSSCHSLLSYFGNKRASGDSAYLDDEHGYTDKTSGRFGINGEWSFLEFKDSDGFEDILRNIEAAQLHVRQLTTRIKKVVDETAEKYTSVNTSLAPHEPLTTSGPSSIYANVNGENHRMGYREAKPIPHLIGAIDRPGTSDKIEKEIVVHNQSVKKELKIEPVENVPNPDSPSKTSVSRDQQCVKTLSKLNTTPKNKRKRGRRKARASRWSKKSSG